MDQPPQTWSAHSLTTFISYHSVGWKLDICVSELNNFEIFRKNSKMERKCLSNFKKINIVQRWNSANSEKISAGTVLFSVDFGALTIDCFSSNQSWISAVQVFSVSVQHWIRTQIPIIISWTELIRTQILSETSTGKLLFLGNVVIKNFWENTFWILLPLFCMLYWSFVRFLWCKMPDFALVWPKNLTLM